MSTQLAIMGDPHFGMRDMSKPGFWFDVAFGDELSNGALIVLSAETMSRLVEEAEVYDIKHLKGKPCQIDVQDNNTVRFVKIIKA
jgi:hypothetical protein